MTSSSRNMPGNVLIVRRRESTPRLLSLALFKGIDVRRAFTRLRRNDYVAVLLNVDLPGIGGNGAFCQIRTEVPGVRIIAVAGEGRLEDRGNAPVREQIIASPYPFSSATVQRGPLCCRPVLEDDFKISFRELLHAQRLDLIDSQRSSKTRSTVDKLVE